MSKKKRRTIDDIYAMPENERYETCEQFERVNELAALMALEYRELWKFYDSDSIELLDEKEDIFTRIKNGEDVSEEERISVLEDYPKGNVWW